MYNKASLIQARYIPFSMFSDLKELCYSIEDDINTIKDETLKECMLAALIKVRPYAINSARLLAQQFTEECYIMFQTHPETYNHKCIELNEFNLIIGSVIDLETVLFETRKIISNQLLGL